MKEANRASANEAADAADAKTPTNAVIESISRNARLMKDVTII